MSHWNTDAMVQPKIHTMSNCNEGRQTHGSNAAVSRAHPSNQISNLAPQGNTLTLDHHISSRGCDWTSEQLSAATVVSNPAESTRETPPLSDSEDDFEDAEGDITDEFSPETLNLEVKRLQKEMAQLKLKQEQYTFAESIRAEKMNALKIERDTAQETNDSLAKELQIMKKTAGIFKDHFQCQICLDILDQPWTLSPCGHIACLSCLYGWFTTPGIDEDPDELQNARHRTKTCPQCRAEIKIAPTPCFVLKNMIEELQLAGLLERPPAVSNSVPSGENPWLKVFGESCSCGFMYDGTDDYSHDGEDEVVGNLHDGEDSDVFSVDSPSETSDSEVAVQPYRGGHDLLMEWYMARRNDYSGSWVSPRWEPPRFELGDVQVTLGDAIDLSLTMAEIHSLLRRGATMGMIRLFHMNYTRENGITAYMGDTKIYLGWNLDRNMADARGVVFMRNVMEEFDDHPERYANISPSRSFLEITRLVPSLGEPEDFEDSDPAWTTPESDDDD
ncbi:hypothetical protein FRC19_005861 [Serendipita sp. 401]|nr:hypothetical protein FRC19_005861 [Serendipita sp. 401]KAG9055844.1 hypothetical protein FS842_001018 [Serendipita sp. 407]